MKPNNLTIRNERPEDFRTVEELTREAFWNVYRPGCVEHYVLHTLRGTADFVPGLTSVLEADGRIVAQITYAQGRRKTPVGQTPLLMFGPLSVLPECQGRGYGSRLIRDTLSRAAELGYQAVVITGDPGYYSRFGFESASRYGLYYEGMEQAGECPFFMVKLLQPEAALAGVYIDPPCFFPQQADVDVFDAGFAPKQKEKRPGQLE
ncbi:MAG: GNAT family N-acetyltransferase [Gemmiger sp.]